MKNHFAQENQRVDLKGEGEVISKLYFDFFLTILEWFFYLMALGLSPNTKFFRKIRVCLIKNNHL